MNLTAGSLHGEGRQRKAHSTPSRSGSTRRPDRRAAEYLVSQFVGVARRAFAIVPPEIWPRQRNAEVAAPRLVLSHEDEPGRHRHHLVSVGDELCPAAPRSAGLFAQLLDVSEIALVVTARDRDAREGLAIEDGRSR